MSDPKAVFSITHGCSLKTSLKAYMIPTVTYGLLVTFIGRVPERPTGVCGIHVLTRVNIGVIGNEGVIVKCNL
jgi:hypothetical protein